MREWNFITQNRLLHKYLQFLENQHYAKKFEANFIVLVFLLRLLNFVWKHNQLIFC
jgi:hypothetical protein